MIRVLWDAASRELAIIYLADIDGRTRTVSENLIFGDDGLVATAEVFHGVPTSIERSAPKLRLADAPTSDPLHRAEAGTLSRGPGCQFSSSTRDGIGVA